LWFCATAPLIFAPFKIVETFSSEADLEHYYLLITAKRKFSADWYLLLLKFVDLFFGFHKVRSLMLPSVVLVFIYTILINLLVTIEIFSTKSIVAGLTYIPATYIRSMSGWLIPTLIANFFFNYINIYKSRRVISYVTINPTFFAIVSGTFEEIIYLLFVLYVSSSLAVVVASSNMVWGMAFFEDIVAGTVTRANVIMASLSMILIILFVLATTMSYVANNFVFG
jgi:hypothetical protein